MPNEIPFLRNAGIPFIPRRTNAASLDLNTQTPSDA